MTCKDCIHYDMCSGFTPTDLDSDVFDYCREGRTDEIPDIEERCSSFKDRNRFIELPCKVGDTVYYLTSVDTEKELNVTEIFRGTTIGISCDKNTSWISAKYANGLFYCHRSKDFGKTVFLTKEDAEKALAERSEGK